MYQYVSIPGHVEEQLFQLFVPFFGMSTVDVLLILNDVCNSGMVHGWFCDDKITGRIYLVPRPGAIDGAIITHYFEFRITSTQMLRSHLVHSVSYRNWSYVRRGSGGWIRGGCHFCHFLSCNIDPKNGRQQWTISLGGIGNHSVFW